jgi:uncharacterized protein YcnI
MTGRRFSAIAATVSILALTAIATASGANAHVTVAAPGLTVGAADGQITFRMPDEDATASSIELKVAFPLDHPITGVLVAPKPGWTATITQTTLSTPIKTDDGTVTDVVSEVDWKADPSAGIQPGFFGDFGIIAGKLPDGVSSVMFKAIQTYSNGKVVSWIEVPAAGAAMPDYPAPTLQLADDSSTKTTTIAASASAPTGASKGAATTGIILGAAGIVIALAALAFVIAQSRRTATRV